MLAQVPVSRESGVTQILPLIDTIDLTMVKQKLMDKEEGQGWSLEHASHVEFRYRRFLCMLVLDPDGSTVPTKEIDTFWHQHILDTRAYAADCLRVFGQFLHHFPYFGMRGEVDAKDLSDSFEQTKAFYLQLFGEEYSPGVGMDAGTCHKGPGSCHKCKSGCGMTCKKRTSGGFSGPRAAIQ